MTYARQWGFFFYSEKQKAVRRELQHPTNFCMTEDGKIHEYTEWASEGIRPAGNWDDYISIGRAKYHHSQ